MILRAQCSWVADTAMPRDRFTITPHFETSGVGAVDAEDLADDLVEALTTWRGTIGECHVTMYDAQGTPPVYPIGDAVMHLGAIPTSDCPREVALCLSYFSTRNIPRHRGRLYIPAALIGPPVGLRPTVGEQNHVGELAAIFAGLGGVDIDWVVYSRADNVGYKVSNWWVDNEWDTVRSRGMKAGSRIVGTTGG